MPMDEGVTRAGLLGDELTENYTAIRKMAVSSLASMNERSIYDEPSERE